MEEWHYAQHLQDHAQEEAEQRAAQPLSQSQSPPRKLRCLECGKRFLRPEHFARHTKWHLRLVRKGIKVCHKRGGKRSSQISYVYKPLGTAENQLGAKDPAGLPIVQESVKRPKSVLVPRAQRGGKRKAGRHPKGASAGVLQEEGVLDPTYPENSMAILDSEVGMSLLLQPWQKQEAILEGQAAGELFQPSIINAENQIIILDNDEAEARSYAEMQTAILDSQGHVNALRPLFFRTEEQGAIVDTQASLQVTGLKEQAAVASGWVGQNPCTLFRTVLLQSEEQPSVLDGQMEPNPLQQVIIKTADGSPTLYVDSEPHLTSLDPATLHFLPVHQEPQFVTVPYGNSLTVDHTDQMDDGDKAWESQAATYQFPGYLPNVYQQNKQPSPTVATSSSSKGPLVVRLVPYASGDHPEVLDLEYDTGGGIPVASEPWEATLGTGQEAYSTEAATEDNFIIVEMDTAAESCGQGLVLDCVYESAREQTAPGVTQPPNSVRRFKCLDCGVCYTRMSQLRSHQRGPKRRGQKYLCECGTSFRGLLHLLRHQLQHLEDSLFICATCGESLKGHKGLTRHEACHPSAARFSCPCGVSFQRLSRYLWHHMRSQQPGLRVYTLSGFLS